jgi:hypothetical protein
MRVNAIDVDGAMHEAMLPHDAAGNCEPREMPGVGGSAPFFAMDDDEEPRRDLQTRRMFADAFVAAQAARGAT